MSRTLICSRGHHWALPDGSAIPPPCPDCGAAALPDVPGFALLSELGHDALGVTYRARQLLYDRNVALLLIHEDALSGPQELSAFCTEARNARFAHPGLVPVLECGDADGRPYLSTELVTAGTLQARLGKGPVAPKTAAALVETLARSLHQAHRHQLYHLGINPARIFLEDDGSPRLGGLGLAVFLRPSKGAPFRSDPAYAAPEQAGAGGAVGPATDVYALGAVLYALLTGHAPFTGATPAETLLHVADGSPVPPHKQRADVPSDLEFICLKCLARSPGRRYASVEALADDLRKFQEGKPVRPTRLPAWAGKLRKEATIASAVAAFFACVSVVLLAVLLIGGRTDKKADQGMAPAERSQSEELAKAWYLLAQGNMERDEAKKQANLALVKADNALADRESALEVLGRTEKERDAARLRHKQEERDRLLAEGKARFAEQVRQQALGRRAEIARELVHLHVTAGSQLLADDVAGAAVWFAEALRLAKVEGLPEGAHRLRLAATLSQCPRVTAVWPADKGTRVALLSPDGKRALLAGDDGTVNLWSTSNGDYAKGPFRHAAAVRQAAFSRDGKFIVSGDAQGAYVWDVEKGKLAAEAIRLAGPVVGVAFSGDGKYILTVVSKGPLGPTEGAVEVWDATTGESVGMPLTADVAARPASFSPDCKRILTACLDRSARLWDFTTGIAVGAAFEHGAEVVQASFGPDGRSVLTVGADGTARVWNAATGKAVGKTISHGAPLVRAVFSGDGRSLLTVGERSARVWDATTGEPQSPALLQSGTLAWGDFSPDGRHVVIGNDRGEVSLRDARTGGDILPALRHNGGVKYAAFLPQGMALFTFDGRAGRIWDLTAGEPPVAGPVVEDGVVLSRDGRLQARIDGKKVQVSETSTRKLVGPATVHSQEVRSVAFGADGKRLLTISQPPEKAVKADTPTWNVRIWDVEKGKWIGEPLEHFRDIRSASFSADGARVVTLGKDKKVRVWDIATSALVGKELVHDDEVSLALLSPDGKHIAVADEAGVTRIWETATGTRLSEAQRHDGPVLHMAFSADGKLMATASADETARVWEVPTGKPASPPLAHGGAVVHVAFSADGKRLATASSDRTARAWDVASGKALVPPLVHAGPVSFVAFSADGNWLLSAAGKTANIWDATSGEPISPPLRHARDERPVRFVSLSADGQFVTDGAPGTRWARPLVADARPVADLTDLAKVLAGRRVESAGAVAPYAAGELTKAWRALERKHSKEFDAPVWRVRAWQRRAAKECEERELWTGAVLHLGALLDIGGEGGDLYARRGRAYLALRQWERATADYSKAIEVDAKRGKLWAERGDAAVGLRRWEQATADYTKAIELGSSGGDVWLKRGQAEAERGRWARAADDFGKAIRAGRNEPAVWHQEALALLANDDKPGYLKLCARLQKRFNRSDGPEAARAVARTCTLAEGAVPDLRRLREQAEQAVASAATPADLRRLALLLYRSGQYEPAIRRTQEALRLSGQEAGALDALVLALAFHRMGQPAEARKWLARAEATPDEAALPWYERQELRLWRQEAEVLGKAKS